MCSLVGFIVTRGNLSGQEKTKLIRALLTEGDIRGGHAAGVAYWEGNTAYTHKSSCLGSELKPIIADNCMGVMGHTRFATKGDCKDNKNNHPFWSKLGYHLAHNGCLYDEKSVREKYGLDMHPSVETDSYLFVQLLDKLGGVNEENIKTVMEEICGSKCISILDESGLWLAKDDNPLELRKIKIKNTELYVYASTAAILDAALKASKLKVSSSAKQPMVQGDILHIPYDGNITTAKFKPNVRDYWSYWCKGVYGVSEYDESERNGVEEQAIQWLSYFGLAEDEIDELLREGYDFDDIFSMVADNSIYDVLQTVTRRLQSGGSRFNKTLWFIQARQRRRTRREARKVVKARYFVRA